LQENGPNIAEGDRATTILVVEDDRAIRYLFTAVLQGNGYVVIACEDGAEGLATAREKINEIDALITDSSMPGLDGTELIAQVRAMRADLPILVVSGSVEIANAGRSLTDPGILYLTKPLSPDRLTLELRKALDGAAPRPSA
jgi:CheY-like chemotaxis protein